MNVIFKNVSKHFGVINALNDVSFEIKSGDFVFLVGPSGAGKSSILKLILHQYHPSNGHIFLDGEDIFLHHKSIVDKTRRNIGVIFQDYQLIADKTIEENIALALDINGVPLAEIPARVEKVINQVNLNSRRHLFPSQLSGGELQRSALARALAVEPKLILADEPTGNLDPENSWMLIKLLTEINAQSRTTIIMTTHNMDIIQSLNKRIIAVKNGAIAADTQPPIVEVKKVIKPKVKKNTKRK